ncbi:MAG: phytanoyl-CoA dioxygenase family protein [Candidatus Binatia bacterium]|nr:phytanoyl-CoA dioxygenase family protein [Candidatus Binatia bacterium]
MTALTTAPKETDLLTTRDMARFVARGFLRFDALIPAVLNERVIDELDALTRDRWVPGAPTKPPATGTPLSQCYPPPSVIGEILRLPRIRGIIQSLVGREPVFDHDFVHLREPRDLWEQHLHADAILDPTSFAFDVQLFYFPQELGPGEGGTRFVPGTHLRRVNELQVGRYQHLLGEKHVSCPAGTIVVFHQGLWHAGQPNASDRRRWMYKIRLNATEPQRRLWNTDDLKALQNGPDDHIFARFADDSVAKQLRHVEPWCDNADYRLEQVQRTQLWRYLTGDETFDVDYYLTRIDRHRRLEQGS